MSAELNGDYIAVVLDDYQKKRERDALALSLVMPSPAKLKRQCILVCRERYRREDDKMLREFFGKGTNKESFLEAIDHFAPSKFKPLVNYLNGKTSNPDFIIIELLAWLIDFEDRPIKYGVKYTVSPGPPGEAVKPVKPVYPVYPDEVDPPSVPAVRKFNFRIAGAILVMTLIFAGIGMYWVRTSGPVPPSSPRGWMRWTGDRFQQVPTAESAGDTMAVPLDADVLVRFKRITDTCAITRAAIGRVWYVKINGRLMFYNSPGLGFDPVAQQLRLKPLTYYMLSKYVRPCQSSGQYGKP